MPDFMIIFIFMDGLLESSRELALIKWIEHVIKPGMEMEQNEMK